MANPLLLEQLRGAVAADVCLEISLAATSELERERADMLANAVRLQDAVTVEAITEQSNE